MNTTSGTSFIWGVYIVAFIIYLCYSYGFFLHSAFPAMGSFAVLLSAILVALAIIRVIGETSKAIYRARKTGIRGWLLVPLTLLPALFFTVLALLPTSVWLFLGPDVVIKDLRYVSANISDMKAGAPGWLAVPKYEEMRAEVEKLAQSLDDEIHSVGGNNNCGVGKAAAETISRIHAILPEIYVYPGTTDTHNCSDTPGIDRIAQRYKDQIELFLNKSDLAIQYNVAERKQFLAGLDPAAARQLQALGEQIDVLARISSFLLDPGAYESATRQLEISQRFYADSYAGMVAFRPNFVPATLPSNVDISHSQSIGRSTEIVSSYAFLPMSIKKVLIVVISFGADLLALYLTWVYLSETGGPRDRDDRGLRGKTVNGIAVLN